MLLLPLTAWGAAQWAGSVALRDLRDTAQSRLALYRAGFESELARHAVVPLVLAGDPAIAGLLASPRSPERVAEVNARLEAVAAADRAAAVYVMDRGGITRAASNWREEGSFVDLNFSYRPYFQTALAGGEGRYFALGTSSDRVGYYLAQPVRSGARVIGAVVVKVDVAALERAWAEEGGAGDGNGGNGVMVTDPDGIVFIANRPGWRLHSLAPLAPERAEAIEASLQYAGNPIAPLDAEPSEPGLITLIEEGRRRTYAVQAADLPGTP